jgi:transposase
MQSLLPRVCGIDVHKKTVAACTSIWDGHGPAQHEKRAFGTVTGELRQLSQWLREREITHVAMEATGVYWEPVWNVLEAAGFELLLVNPEHYKALRGKKTDFKDGERLAEFLQLGQLEGSFIPPPEIRALRAYTRFYARLAEQRATLSNRVQKLLEQCNIKLASVATDVLGVSGRLMLRALLAGQTNPTEIAQLARGTLRRKIPQLAAALEGCLLPHHHVLLEHLLTTLDRIEAEMEQLHVQIEATAQPYAAIWKRWMQIPGVSRTVTFVLLAELGPDASPFVDASRVSSWAGVCPGNYQTGGKRQRGTTRGGNRWLRRALCEAAWAASRTQNTYLASQFRRLAARRGFKRALLAVANSILVIAYCMLQRQTDYRELGPDYLQARQRRVSARCYTRRLQALGYEVALTERKPLP